MARYAYVNGRYVPHGEAAVHVEDRGFQFADGVYEVVTVQEGRMVDEKGHLDRLQRSLDELKMDAPMSRRALGLVMRELVRRNGVRNGIIYLQITRGVSPRDFKFPTDVAPTLVMTTRHVDLDPKAIVEKGVSVITVPEIRWKRRDIKSVSLLPQVLGKQMAAEAGASEAWQVEEDGKVTEGCSSNAWIVTADNVIVTRKASNSILNGITRQSILKLTGGSDVTLEERTFTVEEAYAAREAFLSSATTYVMPITRIDGRAIGDGKPGPIALKLRKAYQDYAAGGST
ncbi:D-amino-acid transaminase [Inquilinus sp. CAU 1745]|uniref:D-amino-acid transaminase n=1 Tax=Inquilinus sp. CAU 1745 TaxID=3140369 RepID=UPI00325B8F77